MDILAVIPARGGSKGIPRKNVKLLAGKPLIAWVIDAAKNAKHVTRTIVSTDDEEIARIARECGAEVPFMRPQEISADLSTDVEFLTHALQELEKEGFVPEILLRLPPTSPMTTAEEIDRGIETLLNDPEADAVRPIIESPKHPYKALVFSEDGKYLVPAVPQEVTGHPAPHDLPRQAFPKAYIHTGAMDVLRRDTVLKHRSTSGKKLAFFHANPETYVNIDYPLDFEIAELLLKKRLGQ